MTTLLNLRPPARALACLWLTSALPVPVVCVLLALFASGFIFFLVCLWRGGPVWDRWAQLLRLPPRRKRGG